MARRLLSTELDDDSDVDDPLMAGSDDKFDDVEDVYLEDVEDNDDDSNGAAPPQSPPNDPQTLSSGSLPFWSSTLTPITIPPFSSPVSPTVDIPE